MINNTAEAYKQIIYDFYYCILKSWFSIKGYGLISY